MLRLPSSHRARVRLARRSIIGTLLAVVVFLLAFERNTGHSIDAPKNNNPVVVVRPPKTVPATATAKREAVRTLTTFTRSAIIRRNLDASWPLADRRMKLGVSHRDWLDGNLPIPPYPAAAFASAGFTLQYSYRGVLGYDVLILPKHTKEGQLAGQQVYSCELHDVRNRWLVDSCYPRKTL